MAGLNELQFTPVEYGASDMISRKMDEKTAKERKWDLVKIDVSGDFINHFFINREIHVNIDKGLYKANWKVLGVTQSPDAIIYSVFLGWVIFLRV